MELTPDLVTIQNLISECERQVGELVKINHKGGNEANIAFVVDKVKQLLLCKKYINDPPNNYTRDDNALKKIILFLILNTKLNDDTLTKIKEYSHLVNIMPKCSKFLLINLTIEMELIDIYGKVATELPLQLVAELFEAANEIFINGHGGKTLKNVDIIVRALIEKVNSTDVNDNHVFDYLRNINNIIVKLLMYLSVHPSICLPKATEIERELHIGYTLFKLFKMLLLVNEAYLACGKIVDALVLTTSIVMKQVTVNTFCAWAEVEEDDMPFQYAIGVEAYKVIEKYTRVKPAAELLALLRCMAKKPKSLSEIISGASISSIVNHINEVDENQRQWFAALVWKSEIFDNPASRECLQRWSALCTIDEVFSLLKLASSKNEASRRLAIKCAAHLSVPNLAILIARSFWIEQPWKSYIEFSSVQPQLTLLLNKMQNGCDENLIRDIQLLMLEDPLEVVEFLFKECIKNEVYIKWMENIFKAIRFVISMNYTPLLTLKDIISDLEQFRPNEQKSITQLMLMLIRTECTEINHLFDNILIPLLTISTGSTENLHGLLNIVGGLPVKLLSESQRGKTATRREELTMLLINNLQTFRVKYSDFCPHKIGICTSSIEILINLSGSVEDMTELNKLELSKLNSYYLTFACGTLQSSLLSHVYPSFVSNSYGQIISQLIKILSRCVLLEWMKMTMELATNLGTQRASDALTDVLILICEVTNTQSAENTTVFNALKYYLSNYSLCLQDLGRRENTVQVEVAVVKNVCRLIKILPTAVKFQEGANMINIFSKRAMEGLSKDRQFVSSLAALGDDKLTQIIANKMLESQKP